MVTQDVTVRSGQRDLLGFVATPDGTSVHPGVVVIHEAFGLNDNIREITRRFGREGYVALAVDLFTGKNKALCMMRFMGATLAGREPSGVSDLRNALDYLTRQPRVDAARVGAIGFCLGGGYAIAWAKGDERLKAIAPFYGTNPSRH